MFQLVNTERVSKGVAAWGNLGSISGSCRRKITSLPCATTEEREK